MDELYGDDLQEWINGWRAAQQGEPLWIHNTIHWLRGYREYWDEKAREAAAVRQSFSLH